MSNTSRPGRSPAAAGGTPESLALARGRLDGRIEEIVREYSGRPHQEVLDELEHEVAAAGVLPSRPDLSALAAEISAAPPPDR